MKLLEHESKKILSNRGITIPKGYVIEGPGEVERITDKVNFPLAVKAQVFTTGRGKAGGVKFAKDKKELRKAVEKLQGGI